MIRSAALVALACLVVAPFISCAPHKEKAHEEAAGTEEVSPVPTPASEAIGPIYGDTYGAIVRIPTDGTAHETLYPNQPMSVVGITLGRDGQYLYFTGMNGDTAYLARIDVSIPQEFMPAVEVLAWAPELGKNAYGLDTDSLGRVYIQGAGTLKRFNPAAAGDGLETVSSSFGPFWDLAISPADEAYGCTFMLSGGGDYWITKLATIVTPAGVFQVPMPWAQAPNDEPNYFVVSGLCFNAKGEAFIMNSTGTKLYKYVDLNGNGDALDLGERSVFANLPGAESETMVFGITAAKGNGVLINRQMYNGGPLTNTGVWLLKDLDGDGSANDPGERTLFSETYIYQGLDAGCLTAAK